MNIGMRLLSFFVSKISAIVIVVLIIVLATFTAYDIANIYVVLNDGMSKRTYTVLNRQDPSELNKFFTLKYLNSDSLLYSDQYNDYLIQDYDYNLKIKRLWAWPWQERTTVTVDEYIPEDSWRFSITQSMWDRLEQLLPETDEDGEKNKIVIKSPPWQNGEKIIEFRKIDRQWKIERIIFVRPMDDDN